MKRKTKNLINCFDVHTVKLRYLLIIFIWLPVAAFAQIKQYGPARTAPVQPSKRLSKPNAQVQVVTPVSLPFWDDFSTATEHSADPLRWLVNDKVFVNDGQGINPPTINVATFDGYNENGVPYSSVSAETGYGDTLESQPIKLLDVPVAQRNNIYLSFFYQIAGNSEGPNISDFLKLEFKSTTGWVEIKRFRARRTMDPTLFYDTAIQIPQAVLPQDYNYFHNNFQFRFTWFGRLSGSYDAWHIDYVYLNKRIFNDKNTNISDRALTKPFSSIFGDYFSIPYEHFKLNPDDYFEKPRFEVFDLKDTIINGVDDHILNYKRFFSIFNYKDSDLISSYVDPVQSDQTIDPILSRERKTYEIGTLPHTSNFDANADSVTVVLRLELGSGDNAEDYYSRYIPINFKQNDVVSDTFLLSNYYAYDDGVAEYTAGLAVQGNQLAYRFVMATATGVEDILNGAYFYFPFFGGKVPSTTVLSVFSNKKGKPDKSLYSQVIPITQTANNLFSEINFTRGVIVKDTFYIGYSETETGENNEIRIGLDASHNTGQHIFSRNSILHAWEQNNALEGSMMIRPRFGPATIITGIINESKTISLYPNPNRGEFYLKGVFNNLQVISITGQPVNFSIEDFEDVKKIKLQGVVPGVYFVRYRTGLKVFTDKILVTAN